MQIPPHPTHSQQRDYDRIMTNIQHFHPITITLSKDSTHFDPCSYHPYWLSLPPHGARNKSNILPFSSKRRKLKLMLARKTAPLCQLSHSSNLHYKLRINFVLPQDFFITISS